MTMPDSARSLNTHYSAQEQAQMMYRYINEQSMSQGGCGRNCGMMCSNQADRLT